MSYRINEIFYSLQGEGARAGSANVFVRFSGCNLECRMEAGPKSPGGFDCDTEFASGRTLELDDLLEAMKAAAGGKVGWCILTGGEPLLQVDDLLIHALNEDGWSVAIETNGTHAIPEGLDWVTVSPKVAEHALRAEAADEVKYVRCHGQGIPKPRIDSRHHYISPAVEAEGLSDENLAWCINLVKQNPQWTLSVQQHKAWSVR